jgi:hypothetical protein
VLSDWAGHEANATPVVANTPTQVKAAIRRTPARRRG